jgi:hypothetical protein
VKEDNPYRPPAAPVGPELARRPPVGRPLKYVVATVGALLVSFAVFVLPMIVAVFVHPDIFKTPSGLIAMYVIVVPIALVAGASSFRSTLRAYRKKSDCDDPGTAR